MHFSHVLLAAGLLWTAPALAATPKDPAKSGDTYEARQYKDASGATLPYRLLVPRKYNPKKPYPLVLFLHGDGERGSDNEAQLRNGGDLFLKQEIRHRYPAFVVFPQMPSGARWVDVTMDKAPSMTFPAKAAEPLRQAIELITALRGQYDIDPRQIYVIGVSDGGFGAWDALLRYPDLFAAGVSMCGGADPAQAPKLVNTPIWVFHSAVDDDVYLPIEKKMVEALQALKARHLKYTEYRDKDHSAAFTAGLEDKGLLPWLMAQKRPGGPSRHRIFARRHGAERKSRGGQLPSAA